MANICYLLSAVLIILKLVGVIAISWWLVMLPALIVIAISVILLLLVTVGACL